MKALTINELLTLSRAQILILAGQIRATLPLLRGETRQNALITLSNIRWVLTRRHKFVPR